MTEQEAIKKINAYMNGEQYSLLNGTCAFAIDALEKQKPKKYKLQGVTDKNGVFHTWNGINGKPYELCPNCEKNLCTDGMNIRNKPHYCMDCGQKLDWGE